MINNMLLALYVQAKLATTDRERGQGTLEYVGMIAVAALLVGVVVTAFGGGASIGTVVTGAITKITSIGGGG